MSMKDFKIKLGVKAKDSVTGFSGIVVGRAEYITGCRQYCVTPKADKNKMNDANWFDEDRLLKSVKDLKPGDDGGPQHNPAPKK